MKDFLEWTLQECIESFEYEIHEYEQLNLDLNYDPED